MSRGHQSRASRPWLNDVVAYRRRVPNPPHREPAPRADPYGADVLAAFEHGPPRRAGARARQIETERDLVLELAAVPGAEGFVGAVVAFDKNCITLEDRRGRRRLFQYGPGFLLDGEPVVLVRPRTVMAGSRPSTAFGPGAAGSTVARTASGSIAVPAARARVALPSRIFVEGRHDAELVERVWGADLRVEGVVVEYLEGVDLLASALDEFSPASGRRVGVLVDHMVPGSKEARIAAAVATGRYGRHVLVVGHPYVDIWQAVKPARLGLAEWPRVPRGTDIKHGTCAALGWPHADQADIANAWQRILGAVRSFRDLEPALIGRVEELIDFVTVG